MISRYQTGSQELSLHLVPSKNSLSEEEQGSDKSSTSTKVSGFSTPCLRNEDDTPSRFESNSPTKLINAQPLDIRDLICNLTAFNLAKKAANNKQWDKAHAELHRIKDPMARDLGYKSIAIIAAQTAAEEIHANTSKMFCSPTTLKAYLFAGRILNLELRKETLQYIDNALPKDEDDLLEEPVTAEMSDILRDFASLDLTQKAASQNLWDEAKIHLDKVKDDFWKKAVSSEVTEVADIQLWNLAKNAACEGRWGEARKYLNEINNDQCRDIACRNIIEIAARAAVEVSTDPQKYKQARFTASTFFAEITDPQYEMDTRKIYNDILEKK